MKYLPSFRALFLAGVGLLALPAAPAQTLIYSDSFSTGTSGSDIQGQTPSVSLTGAVYLGRKRTGNPVRLSTTIGNPPGSAVTGANASVALSLSSGGSYTRAAGEIFALTADLSPGTIAYDGDPSTTRGVGLGFYSAYAAAGNVDAFNSEYTGFNLQITPAGDGTLIFVDGVTTRFGVSVGAGLTASNFYNLSYTVDTSTGNLASLAFNGTDYTSSFSAVTAGQFTTAATAFVGFGGSTSTSTSFTGYVDNLSVVAVPEPPPVTLALLGGAGLAFVLHRRRLSRFA